jgi:hypothetical protein
MLEGGCSAKLTEKRGLAPVLAKTWSGPGFAVLRRQARPKKENACRSLKRTCTPVFL